MSQSPCGCLGGMCDKMRLQLPGALSELLALLHVCEEPDIPSFIDCEKQGQKISCSNIALYQKFEVKTKFTLLILYVGDVIVVVSKRNI